MKVDGVELEDGGRLHASGAKLVELEPVLVVQLHHLFGRATAGRVAHGVLIEGPVALVTVGNLPVLFGRVRLARSCNSTEDKGCKRSEVLGGGSKRNRHAALREPHVTRCAPVSISTQLESVYRCLMACCAD